MNDLASLTAWATAAGATADLDPAPLAATLLSAEPTRRLARLSLTRQAPPSAAVVVGGPRESMLPALQRLTATGVAPARAPHADPTWLARWLVGRWPRGPVVIDHPLAAGDPTRVLGLVAPMPPTRLSLSASPLPFPRASVLHFNALHALTGEPGVVGCRLVSSPTGVRHLRPRWSLRHETLPALADHLGVGAAAREVLQPLLDDLRQMAGRPVPAVIEVSYDPEPLPRLTLEWGPVGVRLATSLARALVGGETALEAAAGALSAPAAFRLRLTCGAEGPEQLEALLPLPGDPMKGPW